ncbi:MAG: aquaporin [Bacteroidota bacterium]|nr:aquaporin [Bacteroidota bacterium]
MQYRKYLAELIGTFMLVFCATGAGIANEASKGTITHVGVAITCGLIILSMIYALGDISGAHLNPAVSIAFAAAKRFSWSQVIPYSIAQTAGAVLASLSLKLLFPSSEFLGATMPSGSLTQSFVMEIILAVILMFVILAVSTGAKEKGITAGIAIASVVGLEIMFAGPICGASMNPARSFGPAIMSGHMEHFWIYLSAPVIGMLIATGLYNVIKEQKNT